MPYFVVAFSVTFSFFMYVIPGKTGLIPKLVLSAGLSGASTLAFVIVAPKIAMDTIG